MKKPYTVEEREGGGWTCVGPTPCEWTYAEKHQAQREADKFNAAFAAGLREGAQGIVKEGPSVEDIMGVVEQWIDARLMYSHIVRLQLHDLRTRLSALFPQKP